MEVSTPKNGGKTAKPTLTEQKHEKSILLEVHFKYVWSTLEVQLEVHFKYSWKYTLSTFEAHFKYTRSILLWYCISRKT